METILEGIVIGVSSGAILASVFWLTGFVTARNEKRDQVEHLSNVIGGFRASILEAADIEVTLGEAKRHFARDEVRKAYYDDMRRQVELALQGRSSRLSFDETSEIRQVFYSDYFPGLVLNDDAYDKLFGALESIRWLGLPPRTT